MGRRSDRRRRLGRPPAAVRSPTTGRPASGRTSPIRWPATSCPGGDSRAAASPISSALPGGGLLALERAFGAERAAHPALRGRPRRRHRQSARCSSLAGGDAHAGAQDVCSGNASFPDINFEGAALGPDARRRRSQPGADLRRRPRAAAGAVCADAASLGVASGGAPLGPHADRLYARRAPRYRGSAEEATPCPPTRRALQPLPPDEWNDEVRELLQATQMGGRVLNIFADARPSPEAAQALAGVRQPRAVQVDAVAARARAADPAHRLELPRRVRVGAARGDRQAGRHHRRGDRAHHARARRAGLGSASRRRCCAPPTSCIATAASATRPGKRSARTTTRKQLMDVVFTVGQYTLVSMALNSFGVQLDEGIPGFPREAERGSPLRRSRYAASPRAPGRCARWRRRQRRRGAQQAIAAEHGDAEPVVLVLEVVQPVVAPQPLVERRARHDARVHQEVDPLVVQRQREVRDDRRSSPAPASAPGGTRVSTSSGIE